MIDMDYWLTRGSRSSGRDNERVMARGLEDLAQELRLIDIADFISYIREDKLGHVDNLVQSAAEVVLKPGVIRFASSARVDVDWEALPRIYLDLEFINQGVRVYFTLVLERKSVSVTINSMAIAGVQLHDSAEDRTRRLVEAMTDALDVGKSDDNAYVGAAGSALLN